LSGYRSGLTLIKLMIICSLVIPHFDGAFYVYNHLVRPYLLLNPALLCKRDHFLPEAERYVKENGPEALEKLIDKEVCMDYMVIKIPLLVRHGLMRISVPLYNLTFVCLFIYLFIFSLRPKSLMLTWKRSNLLQPQRKKKWIW